jgi:hypothetical protein
MACETYLDAWGAALFAGRLSSEGTLMAVSRAAKSAPRSHGARRPCDLLLDSVATLVTDGLAAAAPPLQDVTRIFTDEETPAAESLGWGWLTVVPTYVLWDEDACYSICDGQLRALRAAWSPPRLCELAGGYRLPHDGPGEDDRGQEAEPRDLAVPKVGLVDRLQDNDI